MLCYNPFFLNTDYTDTDAIKSNDALESGLSLAVNPTEHTTKLISQTILSDKPGKGFFGSSETNQCTFKLAEIDENKLFSDECN